MYKLSLVKWSLGDQVIKKNCETHKTESQGALEGHGWFSCFLVSVSLLSLCLHLHLSFFLCPPLSLCPSVFFSVSFFWGQPSPCFPLNSFSCLQLPLLSWQVVQPVHGPSLPTPHCAAPLYSRILFSQCVWFKIPWERLPGCLRSGVSLTGHGHTFQGSEASVKREWSRREGMANPALPCPAPAPCSHGSSSGDALTLHDCAAMIPPPKGAFLPTGSDSGPYSTLMC